MREEGPHLMLLPFQEGPRLRLLPPLLLPGKGPQPQLLPPLLLLLLLQEGPQTCSSRAFSGASSASPAAPLPPLLLALPLRLLPPLLLQHPPYVYGSTSRLKVGS